jgi:soluble lytic murein transglycosylase
MRQPPGSSPVEAAFVLGIIRQESGFDAHIRSSVGARGMMQLMPSTAKILAKKAGVRYRESMLDDAEYNMRLGSTYLGSLVGRFDGSYIMAAAAYNSGPNRPGQWFAACGDPRAASGDPVDFIECIPIGETRNYVMRVMENVQVYRARLNGGKAPLTLPADLRRGGYGQPKAYAEEAQNTLRSPGAPATAVDVVAPRPIADPPARPHLIRARDEGRHGKLHKASARAHHLKARHRKSEG